MILGIHDGHNSSASLISDRGIEYAISEERFTRRKNERGFPSKAVDYILGENRDIDLITVGGMFRRGKRLRAIKEFQERLNIPLLYFHHHLCHGALYKLSDFKECLVVTIDGGGDSLSATVSIGGKEGLEVIAQSDILDSLGDFYASITEVLGFKPMEDEGKVMCLSSYPGEELDIGVIIDYDSRLKSFKNYLGVVGQESTKALRRILQRFNIDPYNMDFNTKVKVAKYAQRVLEEVVLKMIRDFSEETGIDKVVFSGGVAQNVKLNRKIGELYDVYIPPFMGDEGLSIGSSLLEMKKKIELRDTYLGYNISDEKVEKLIERGYLKGYNIKYLEEREIAETLGHLLLENKILCICRGRMEFGPRALGNRSIVALPSRENRDRLNRLLQRDSFMPFAPTILYEHVEDYLVDPKYCPFMTMVFQVKKEVKEKIEGVVHVDNTTRPQTLKRDFNSIYYDTIDYLYQCIDLPVVLNTSFNIHGEPIVCTELDGIRTFKAVGDALLLGNWLIEKRD
ncbi:MAG TPA: hypothetical protein EYP47_00595 [Methanococcaceae archaeon]|uniref:Carbamoyltransferase n=1 Tax=Methanothermococcus okinawensis TaxID=155863 RepID=A0A832ZJR0_9EURY|nr:hypothetical protein [Methanococcaceae archaeon]HIP91742.1 hypothetical protein [Methanothermococcus okinawensis]